jgi:T5SS/PEP-CTERM-associated repeat protein
LQAGSLAVNAAGTVSATNGATIATGTAGGIDSLALAASGSVAATVDLQSGAGWISTTGIEVGLGTIALAGGTLQSAAVAIGTGDAGVTASLISMTGPASRWIDGGPITVGVNRPGTLALAAGAALEAPGNLIAGQSAGGNGTVTDDGFGTTLAVAGNLVIGQGGAGTLAVTNGAAFFVGGTLEVGGSSGVGTVTDTGDGFRTFGALAIANGVAHVAPGITNFWNVDLGGAQNIDIGGLAGGNATLDVVATGTVIEGTGTVTVGDAGAGTLAIGANALFDAPVNAITIGGASGSNGLVTLAGAGAILDGGTLAIGASNGTGTLSIGAGGSVLAAAALVGGAGLVALAGSLEVKGSLSGAGSIGMEGGLLHLDTPGAVSAAVSGFAPGDTIDLKGVNPASVSFAAGTLSFAGGSFPLSVSHGTVQAHASADGAAVTVACFCAGTRILTDAGEVAVEALRPGMRAISLAHSRALRICWVGSRTVAPAAPVRVAADAFGEGAPHTELWLSPDHAVHVGDALIPVRHLVNGASIACIHRTAETYFHVELTVHGVLITQGLPAESFLDTGNRTILDQFHLDQTGANLDRCGDYGSQTKGSPPFPAPLQATSRLASRSRPATAP